MAGMRDIGEFKSVARDHWDHVAYWAHSLANWHSWLFTDLSHMSVYHPEHRSTLEMYQIARERLVSSAQELGS